VERWEYKSGDSAHRERVNGIAFVQLSPFIVWLPGHWFIGSSWTYIFSQSPFRKGKKKKKKNQYNEAAHQLTRCVSNSAQRRHTHTFLTGACNKNRHVVVAFWLIVTSFTLTHKVLRKWNNDVFFLASQFFRFKRSKNKKNKYAQYFTIYA